MRDFSMITIAVLALGVVACGQTKSQAEADLAAKEAAAVPKPAAPGAAFVGEAPPPPLATYTVPAEAAAAAE